MSVSGFSVQVHRILGPINIYNITTKMRSYIIFTGEFKSVRYWGDVFRHTNTIRLSYILIKARRMRVRPLPKGRHHIFDKTAKVSLNEKNR